MALVGFIFWSFRHPVFLGIVLIGLLWIAFAPYLGINGLVRRARRENPDKYSEDEWKMIRKFPTFIFYPKASRQVAWTFTFCRFSSVGVSVLFLWQHRWIELLIAFPGWFVFGYLAYKLEPDFFIAEVNPHLEHAGEPFQELRDKIRIHGL